MFGLVCGRKNQQHFCSIIERHYLLLMIDKNSQTYLVEKDPLLFDKALVNEVKVL